MRERTSRGAEHRSAASIRYVLNHEDATAGASLVRIRLVTVRLRKDGSVTDEKPYDPENVTRPKEQRARFLTETDCNHLRDIMWLKRARGNFGQADLSLGPDAASLAILMALTKSGRQATYFHCCPVR
jgi:hypothetical protein